MATHSLRGMPVIPYDEWLVVQRSLGVPNENLPTEEQYAQAVSESMRQFFRTKEAQMIHETDTETSEPDTPDPEDDEE